jgi:uncharacterized protein (UPF0303 family)
VTALAVHAEDLGPDLFRATATAGTLAAAITGDTVTLTRSGDGGPAVVDVALDRQPAWSVAIAGGATAATLDLATGRVGTIDLASGVSTFEMGLPAARGTTRVVMSGGSSQMRVHLTGPSPVRVTLAGGAGSVEVDGASRSGVPGGTVLVPPTWSAAHDRYDILCSAGVSALVVDRAA